MDLSIKSSTGVKYIGAIGRKTGSGIVLTPVGSVSETLFSQYGYDKGNSAYFEQEDAVTDTTLQFSESLDGFNFQHLIVHNNILYFGTDAGSLYAVDVNGPTSYTEKYKYTSSNDLSETTPTTGEFPDRDGEYAFIGDLSGNLHEIDGDGSGTKNVISSSTVSSPKPHLNSLYFESNGTVEAWPLESGAPEWTKSIGSSASVAVAISDGVVYAMSSDNNALYALDESDGSEQWTASTDNSLGAAAPVAAEDALFLADDNGVIYRFETDGSRTWTSSVPTNFFDTGIAVANGTVFVPAVDNNEFHAFDVSDGSTQWSLNDVWPFSSPIVAGDLVYYSTWANNQGVTARNVSDGSVAHRFTAGSSDFETRPWINNGIIYSISYGPTLHAWGGG